MSLFIQIHHLFGFSGGGLKTPLDPPLHMSTVSSIIKTGFIFYYLGKAIFKEFLWSLL